MDNPWRISNIYVIMTFKTSVYQMVRLQKGRQAVNRYLGVWFDDCQWTFVHKFGHLLLRRRRESHNENVAISDASFAFLKTPQLKNSITNIPELKETSIIFFSFFFLSCVWCWKFELCNVWRNRLLKSWNGKPIKKLFHSQQYQIS